MDDSRREGEGGRGARTGRGRGEGGRGDREGEGGMESLLTFLTSLYLSFPNVKLNYFSCRLLLSFTSSIIELGQ